MESKYYMNGNSIVSIASGNVVATVTDGVVSMAPGYNGQGRAVKEWYAEFKDAPPPPPPDAPDAPDAPENTEYTENPDFILPDPPEDDPLPDDELPPDPIPGTLSVGTAAPPDETIPQGSKTAQLIIGDIPDDQLPVMDAARGVSTPEVAAFIKKHKLDADQITALIRRIELKLSKGE